MQFQWVEVRRTIVDICLIVAATALVILAANWLAANPKPRPVDRLPRACAGVCEADECGCESVRYVRTPAPEPKPFTVQCPWCRNYSVVRPPATGATGAVVGAKPPGPSA